MSGIGPAISGGLEGMTLLSGHSYPRRFYDHGPPQREAIPRVRPCRALSTSRPSQTVPSPLHPALPGTQGRRILLGISMELDGRAGRGVGISIRRRVTLPLQPGMVPSAECRHAGGCFVHVERSVQAAIRSRVVLRMRLPVRPGHEGKRRFPRQPHL